MAKDQGYGMKVTAEIIDTLGECSAGHKIGDKFDISITDTAALCGYFYHSIFANLQTFQFGGKMPWWQGDEIVLTCPDPNKQMKIRLKRQKR